MTLAQPSPAAIAAAILSTPMSLRLGLAVRDRRLQERCATRLAERIVADLGQVPPDDDPRQLALGW